MFCYFTYVKPQRDKNEICRQLLSVYQPRLLHCLPNVDFRGKNFLTTLYTFGRHLISPVLFLKDAGPGGDEDQRRQTERDSDSAGRCERRAGRN